VPTDSATAAGMSLSRIISSMGSLRSPNACASAAALHDFAERRRLQALLGGKSWPEFRAMARGAEAILTVIELSPRSVEPCRDTFRCDVQHLLNIFKPRVR
jgi:hypothetical protein